MPLYEREVLPKPPSLLNQDKNFTCFTELLKVCEQVYQNTITAGQVKMVEEKTREQSSSKLWFQQRAGCVTASKLRNVLHIRISNPSKITPHLYVLFMQKWFVISLKHACMVVNTRMILVKHTLK